MTNFKTDNIILNIFYYYNQNFSHFLYINRRIKISPLKRDIKVISHISHFYVSIQVTSRELCLRTVEVIKDPPRRYTRTTR